MNRDKMTDWNDPFTLPSLRQVETLLAREKLPSVNDMEARIEAGITAIINAKVDHYVRFLIGAREAIKELVIAREKELAEELRAGNKMLKEEHNNLTAQKRRRR